MKVNVKLILVDSEIPQKLMIDNIIIIMIAKVIGGIEGINMDKYPENPTATVAEDDMMANTTRKPIIDARKLLLNAFIENKYSAPLLGNSDASSA
ncbi:protein of unknown function [Candidatus Nitrosocosmicus franklandus]|uniref:Uncharacterized protein n=1 Tax=Candidatus Nitrosocosmicus franklandianus TaxID=1798806 RepID=A0A484IHL3_9ARCH|nr:protein of unknown function [Candidatus Nitrosocosmicus franklandus]